MKIGQKEFADAIENILKFQCSPDVVRSIEKGGSATELWNSLEKSGFLELLAEEDSGGANLSLPELFEVLCHFGRYVVPLPVGQRIVARALVAPSVALPQGMITLAPSLQHQSDNSIICHQVPFGGIADHVLAADRERLLLLPCINAQRLTTGTHHSQVATLKWPHVNDTYFVAGESVALAPFAAALHAALITGAMVRVFEMTLQYCHDRSQFGKTLDKFQAIQHQLSVMAEQVVAVSIATEAAFQTDARVPRLLPAAIAKARASEAVVYVANTAHALHGAIGITEKYDLQLFTRRLHEWRIAHGSEAYWNCRVGEAVLSGNTLAEFVRTV